MDDLGTGSINRNDPENTSAKENAGDQLPQNRRLSKSFGELTQEGTLPFHSWFVAYLPSSSGATDADLAVLTFSYSAVVPGNVSAEVVKYFLQLYYGLDQDLRLDPKDFSLVTAN